MYNIDLHIHTTCSDGSFTPIEIIDLAKKHHLEVISISDHDCIDAYNDEFFAYAKKCNLKIITGIEISTRLANKSYHVLGYNFDINNDALKKEIALLKNSRLDYLYNVGNKLKELGFYLDIDKLEKIDIVTKAHIAKEVVNNELNDELLHHYFKHIPSFGEFIETIMNEGCIAFVEKKTITPMQASELIKNAGGKVVLAHPVCYRYEDGTKDDEIMSLIDSMHVDGIEAGYIYLDVNGNKVNEVIKWQQVAKDKNLFITVGSDFHHDDKIHPMIGLIDECIGIDDREKKQIIDSICK